MDLLNDLETTVTELAESLGAPTNLIPTFAISRQDGTAHVEVTGKEYHFVVSERGTEMSRQSTFDKKEVLFWIFDAITFSMASQIELKNRRSDEDFRIQLFEIQENLISKIEPAFARTLREKHKRLLK